MLGVRNGGPTRTEPDASEDKLRAQPGLQRGQGERALAASPQREEQQGECDSPPQEHVLRPILSSTVRKGHANSAFAPQTPGAKQYVPSENLYAKARDLVGTHARDRTPHGDGLVQLVEDISIIGSKCGVGSLAHLDGLVVLADSLVSTHPSKAVDLFHEVLQGMVSIGAGTNMEAGLVACKFARTKASLGEVGRAFKSLRDYTRRLLLEQDASNLCMCLSTLASISMDAHNFDFASRFLHRAITLIPRIQITKNGRIALGCLAHELAVSKFRMPLAVALLHRVLETQSPPSTSQDYWRRAVAMFDLAHCIERTPVELRKLSMVTEYNDCEWLYEMATEIARGVLDGDDLRLHAIFDLRQDKVAYPTVLPGSSRVQHKNLSDCFTRHQRQTNPLKQTSVGVQASISPEVRRHQVKSKGLDISGNLEYQKLATPWKHSVRKSQNGYTLLGKQLRPKSAVSTPASNPPAVSIVDFGNEDSGHGHLPMYLDTSMAPQVTPNVYGLGRQNGKSFNAYDVIMEESDLSGKFLMVDMSHKNQSQGTPWGRPKAETPISSIGDISPVRSLYPASAVSRSLASPVYRDFLPPPRCTSEADVSCDTTNNTTSTAISASSVGVGGSELSSQEMLSPRWQPKPPPRDAIFARSPIVKQSPTNVVDKDSNISPSEVAMLITKALNAIVTPPKQGMSTSAKEMGNRGQSKVSSTASSPLSRQVSNDHKTPFKSVRRPTMDEYAPLQGPFDTDDYFQQPTPGAWESRVYDFNSPYANIGSVNSSTQESPRMYDAPRVYQNTFR